MHANVHFRRQRNRILVLISLLTFQKYFLAAWKTYNANFKTLWNFQKSSCENLDKSENFYSRWLCAVCGFSSYEGSFIMSRLGGSKDICRLDFYSENVCFLFFSVFPKKKKLKSHYCIFYFFFVLLESRAISFKGGGKQMIRNPWPGSAKQKAWWNWYIRLVFFSEVRRELILPEENRHERTAAYC